MTTLLKEVEAAMLVHGISPTWFGFKAANDPNFVSDLRAGRRPRAVLSNKVRAYIKALEKVKIED